MEDILEHPLSGTKAARTPVSSGQTLRGRFLRGAFWSVVGVGTSQILSLAASGVTARLLGRTGFGELAMIRSTVGMFGVFAGMGLGLTATKHVAEFRERDPNRAGRIIGLSFMTAAASGGVISLVVLFTAPVLATRVMNAPHLAPLIRIAAGLLFLNALNGVQTGTLAGFEAFKAIAKVNLIYGALSFPVTVVAVWLYGLTGAVCGLIALRAVRWALNRSALVAETSAAMVSISHHRLREESPVLWGFSLPAVLSGAMVGPVTWICNAMLVNHPDGYGELGVFAAASRFQAGVAFAGSTIGAAFLPMLSTKEGSESAGFRQGNILVSWVIGVLAAVPLICFPEILGYAFGAEFSSVAAKRTLMLVMCSTCIILYKQGLARALTAEGLLWWGLLSNTIWAVLLLGSAWWLTQRGAAGLAAAFLLAYGLNTVMFVPFYTRRGLVPKGTMVSPEAALIWMLIGGLAVLSVFTTSLLIRSIAACSCVVALYLTFRRLVPSLGSAQPADGRQGT